MALETLYTTETLVILQETEANLGALWSAGEQGPAAAPSTPISASPGNLLELGPDGGLYVQLAWASPPTW